MGESQQLLDTSTGGLKRNSLGPGHIVFFVVAFAAPLTVVAGVAPLTLRLGGIGAPGSYVVAGIVLAFFAAGFTAMSRHVTNAGAFYAYVSKGLGKPLGVGAALLAIWGYDAFLVGLFGGFGFFTSLTVSDLFGLNISWVVWAVLAVVLVGYLGYRQIDLSATVLGVLLTAEVAILLAVSIAVLVKGGPEGMSVASFSPTNVFSGAAGVLFCFTFGAFAGFEGTAIYSEEARNPERTIPLATYVAIGFLTIFYAFSVWAITVAFGKHGVINLANSDGFADMYFIAATTYLGRVANDIMRILILTSMFAALLSIHNCANRYYFALGRERIIPSVFGRTHHKTKSPHVAGLWQTGLSLVVVAGFAIAHADPYLQLMTWLNGSAALAVIGLQALCAVAVLGFFWRDRRGHGVFRVVVAPTIGGAGLATGFYLAATHFGIITVSTGAVTAILMLPIPLAVICGIVWALRTRHARPEVYASMTEVAVE